MPDELPPAAAAPAEGGEASSTSALPAETAVSDGTGDAPASTSTTGEQTAASTEGTQTAEAKSSEPDAHGSVRDFITKGLADIESGKTAEPDAGEKDKAASAEKPTDEKPETTSEEKKEEDKSSSSEGEDKSKSEEKESDEEEGKDKDTKEADSETEEPGLMTREEIDKNFPRTSKEIRDVAARNAEIAGGYKKTIDELGGEPFMPALKMISEGLQQGTNQPVFTGFLAASGVENFVDFLQDAVKLAIVEVPRNTEPKNEGEKYLQDQCKKIVDTVIADRLGKDANWDYIEKLWRYESEGHLNTAEVDEFYGKEGGPDGKPNPIISQKDKEIETLKTQLQEAQTGKTERSKNEEQRHAEEFDRTASENAQKTLDLSVYKRSALRPIKTDPPELAEGKNAARVLLEEATTRWLKENPKYKSLRRSDFKGESQTAKFQRTYGDLMDEYGFEAKRLASGLEKLVNQVYQLTRNGSLDKNLIGSEGAPPPEKEKEAPKPEPTTGGEPTMTKTPPKEQYSQAAWRKHLRDEIASIS